MAQVEITVNGRSYAVGCDDGQENHIGKLGRYLDQKVAALVNNMGQIGDARLAVMAGLLIADELYESEQKEGEKPKLTAPPPPPDRPAIEIPPADRQTVDRIAGGRGIPGQPDHAPELAEPEEVLEDSIDVAALAEALEDLAIRIEQVAMAMEQV